MAQQQVIKFLEEYNRLEQGVMDNLSEQSCAGNISCAREELQKLTRLVSENAASLPSYELRKVQAGITNLQAKINTIEEESRPQKQPFKFIRKDKEKSVTAPVMSGRSTGIPITGEKSSVPSITGLKNETVILGNSEITSTRDLWLDDLEKCRIIIQGTPSTLHMTRLSDCQVIGGPILTSIFLDNCHRSTFVIGCQQLRTHKSTGCDFYLYVRSRAIIEDCNGCRFAPYNREYPRKDEDFTEAKLDLAINNWNLVDDFNWLSESPSPNWSILPENERVQQWVV